MSSSKSQKALSLIKQRIDVVLFLVCVLFFLVFPNLDLTVADQFYSGSFSWNENVIIKAIYKIFAKIHLVYLLILIGLITMASIKHWGGTKYASIYLLSALLLGPGLLVNITLKDNSVGRPRPVHVLEFGGDRDYTPVFHYSGQCKKNCSFVSGHASIGFFTMALFWVTRRKSWFIAGLAMGAAVGFTRIVQGGHFLSDVIFAGWCVYFVCLGLAKAFDTKLPSTKLTSTEQTSKKLS